MQERSYVSTLLCCAWHYIAPSGPIIAILCRHGMARHGNIGGTKGRETDISDPKRLGDNPLCRTEHWMEKQAYFLFGSLTQQFVASWVVVILVLVVMMAKVKVMGPVIRNWDFHTTQASLADCWKHAQQLKHPTTDTARKTKLRHKHATDKHTTRGAILVLMAEPICRIFNKAPTGGNMSLLAARGCAAQLIGGPSTTRISNNVASFLEKAPNRGRAA